MARWPIRWWPTGPTCCSTRLGCAGGRSRRLEATAGRQAINLDNQRWIGSVGWRQNDQTLDAARVVVKPAPGAPLDYLHAWRVNRVFGPDSPQGIWRDTAINGLRAAYTLKNVGTLSAYGYWLDIPSSTGQQLQGRWAYGSLASCRWQGNPPSSTPPSMLASTITATIRAASGWITG
jgi:hypothetical protein